MKNIWFILFAMMILFSGCAEKPVIISEGYDYTSFGTGIEVYTEISDHNLVLHVNNNENKFYKIWIIHKYYSRIKKGDERQMVYEGRDIAYNVNVLIPEDENKIEIKHIFIVKILDVKGDVLYESPILNLKTGERKNE